MRIRSMQGTGATASLTLFLTIALLGCVLSGRSVAESGNKFKDTFRFVVYGDTRDGHDIHRRLVALIMQQKPDLVIQTGDLVHRGNQEDLWKIYDDITSEMRAKIPVYPARGNHDVGGPGYEARMTQRFASGNKLYYSFNKQKSHFICLAVDENSEYDSKSVQYAWLVKDLEAAQKSAQNIFVFFHVPPYSIGSHGSDLAVRRELCPLFKQYGVRAVLNGHDHIYYRTVRDGILYIVSGGGGAALYEPDPKKGAIEGDVWKKLHHIVVCDVKGTTVTGTVLGESGETLDQFTYKPGSATSN